MSQQRRFRVSQVMPLSMYATNQPPPDPVAKFKFLLQSMKACHNACVRPLCGITVWIRLQCSLQMAALRPSRHQSGCVVQ